MVKALKHLSTSHLVPIRTHDEIDEIRKIPRWLKFALGWSHPVAVGNSEVEPILIELKHGSAGGVKRAFWRYDTIVVKGSETHWFEAPRTSLELVKQGEGDGRQRTQFRK